jgi:hypothetical protein
MPKDEPSDGLGHRHDWEGVIVWLSSSTATTAANIVAVCPSAHGGMLILPYLAAQILALELRQGLRSFYRFHDNIAFPTVSKTACVNKLNRVGLQHGWIQSFWHKPLDQIRVNMASEPLLWTHQHPGWPAAFDRVGVTPNCCTDGIAKHRLWVSQRAVQRRKLRHKLGSCYFLMTGLNDVT